MATNQDRAAEQCNQAITGNYWAGPGSSQQCGYSENADCYSQIVSPAIFCWKFSDEIMGLAMVKQTICLIFKMQIVTLFPLQFSINGFVLIVRAP